MALRDTTIASNDNLRVIIPRSKAPAVVPHHWHLNITEKRWWQGNLPLNWASGAVAFGGVSPSIPRRYLPIFPLQKVPFIYTYSTQLNPLQAQNS